VRTKQLVPSATRFHPVILCPGLGSSGAYTFDLSPNVSLADYLASNGWDVWTVELRGEPGDGNKGAVGWGDGCTQIESMCLWCMD
jgi:poly(3-hydroxyalkanoate) synthetase